MIQIEFVYNDISTTIQCNLDKTLKKIVENDLFPKIKINLDSVTYLYSKKEIKNLESILDGLIKNEDKENNNIIIEIFDPINIDSHEYKIVEEIGEGGFSKVYKVLNKEDNKFYALKVIKNQMKESLSIFENEWINLSKLDNKNIVKYYGSKNDEKKLYILMEYCDGLNLEEFLEEHKKPNEENKVILIKENTLYNIIKQICSGIKEIHDKNIVHRDLKPSNIFINKDNEIKIGDFGISKQLNALKKTTLTKKGAGTSSYIAPEIFKKSKYNNKSDMYSLGCIIYELFTLNEYHTDKLSDDIKSIDNMYDSNWQKILNSLLIVDTNKRFDINQANSYILNCIRIKIYVKMASGSVEVFNVYPDQRIKFINIWFKDYGYEKISLIYRGKNINPKNIFKDYGIESEDIIYMYSGIRGCGYGGKHIKIYMKYKDITIDLTVCPNCTKVRDLKINFLRKFKNAQFYDNYKNYLYKEICKLRYNWKILCDEDMDKKIRLLGIGEGSVINVIIDEELFEYTEKYSAQLYDLYIMGFDEEEINLKLLKQCYGDIPRYFLNIFEY